MLHFPPGGKRPPLVIGVHGMISDKASPKQIELARRLNEIGIAYLRFDHRGCGESDGAFRSVTTFAGRKADVLSAIGAARSSMRFGEKFGIFGSSMGGAAGLAAATEGEEIAAIVTLAAPIRSDFFDSALRHLESVGETQALTESKALPVEGLRFDLTDRLFRLKNLLAIHGADDRIVPVTHARELYEKAGEPKALVIQEGGDHRMSDPVHQAVFMEAAVDFFQKRLKPPAE